VIRAVTRHGHSFVLTDKPDATIPLTAGWIAAQEEQGARFLPIFTGGRESGAFRVAEVAYITDEPSRRSESGSDAA